MTNPLRRASQSPGRGPAIVFAREAGDEVYGCAGAILRHRAQGDRVAVMVLCADPSPGASAGEIETECTRAAGVLGYGKPVFLGKAPADLRFSEAGVEELLRAIEQAGANMIYVPASDEDDPAGRGLEACVREAVRRCSRPVHLAVYELACPVQANLLLDIGDLTTTKAEAMRCYRSRTRLRASDEDTMALNRFRATSLPAHVTAAEAYHLVSRDDLRQRVRAARPIEEDRRAIGGHGPLVSVLVRTLSRSTLQTTLDSIARQTYDSIEVVVVDAGATGLDLANCGRFPARVCRGDGKLTRVAAANLALDEANGQYLLMLDDDDWLYPDHVAGLATALADERLGRAVYAGVECVAFAGEGTEVVRTLNEPFDANRLLYENFIPVHAMMFARTLTEEGCRFDPALSLYEDWDFWLQVSVKTHIRHLDRVSAAYRMPGASGGSDEVTQAAEVLFRKWSEILPRARWASLLKAMRTQELARVSLLAEFSSLKGDLRHASAFISGLEAQVADLLASYSWRVTGPMRAAGRVARALKARLVPTP